MKKIILTMALATLGPTALLAESIPDQIANAVARIALKHKVEKIQDKALLCNPFERDPKNNLDVVDWMLIEPEAPHWKMLRQFSTVAPEAQKYALSKRGSDKVLHCYAGCFSAKKLDLASGIYIGWYKELVDSSDCSSKTRFEKEDYEATHAGALVASKIMACEDFCGSELVKNLDGKQMLELAQDF